MINIKDKLNNCKKELLKIDKELETLPPGHLGKRKTYYHITKNRQIGISKKPKIIRQLARKKYLLVRKAQLENNISKPLNKFNSATPKELIASLPNAYRNLPESYFWHPSIEAWIANPPKKNTLNPEHAKYNSSNNIQFRSLMERIIAEVLNEYSLPYHYDTVIKIGGEEVSPDFIIKNPFTGETFIWEHFGAFNHEGYADSMNRKMNLYMKNGLTPFKNLIATYAYHIEDTARIKELIEQIIL